MSYCLTHEIKKAISFYLQYIIKEKCKSGKAQVTCTYTRRSVPTTNVFCHLF